MNEAPGNATAQREFFCEAPLAGLAAAYETPSLLAWDTAGRIALVDRSAQSVRRLAIGPGLAHAAISADGSLVALVTSAGACRWFDAGLQPRGALELPGQPVAVALDPLGWHLAVADQTGDVYLFDCTGRRLARTHSLRAIRFLSWAAERPLLIAAGADGSLAAFGIDGRVLWRASGATRVGDLAIDAPALRIVLPAFGAGLLRFDAAGQARANVPTLEMPSRAALNPAGDRLLVASLAHEVVLQEFTGRILWRQGFESPVAALALAPLAGRGWIGLDSGRVVEVPFDDPPSAQAEPAAAPLVEPLAAAARAAPLGAPLEPAWTCRLNLTPETARQVSLALLAEPLRIGLLAPDRTLRVYAQGLPAAQKQPVHTSGVLDGVGRTLLAGHGRFLALSDRRILVYDAYTNRSHVTEARLVEVTHAQRCGAHELLVIEERQRLSRLWYDGRATWKLLLDQPVDTWAVGRKSLVIAGDAGSLIWIDLHGRELAREAGAPQQRRLVAACDEGFVSVDPAARVARHYSAEGALLAEVATPGEVWSLVGLGPRVLARAPSGRGWLFDRDHRWRAEAPPHSEASLYFPRGDALPGRIYDQSNCLWCGDVAGGVGWRHVHDLPLGAVAAADFGAAAILGQRLAWFPMPRGSA